MAGQHTRTSVQDGTRQEPCCQDPQLDTGQSSAGDRLDTRSTHTIKPVCARKGRILTSPATLRTARSLNAQTAATAGGTRTVQNGARARAQPCEAAKGGRQTVLGSIWVRELFWNYIMMTVTNT